MNNYEFLFIDFKWLHLIYSLGLSKEALDNILQGLSDKYSRMTENWRSYDIVSIDF